MGAKKFAIYAGLLLVIIVAVVIAAKRSGGDRPIPDWLLDQPLPKIDRNTLELVTATNRDWLGKYAPDAHRNNKNPKTGAYTMVDPMTCAACGQPIPPPDYWATYKPGEDPEAQKAAADKAYRCPRCGKPPFGSQ